MKGLEVNFFSTAQAYINNIAPCTHKALRKSYGKRRTVLTNVITDYYFALTYNLGKCPTDSLS